MAVGWTICAYVAPWQSRDDTLAYWENSWALWLDDWVADGRLQEVKRGGYPSLYTGKVRDLAPMLLALKQRHPGEFFQLYPERIVACAPEQELTLEVWDQS